MADPPASEAAEAAVTDGEGHGGGGDSSVSVASGHECVATAVRPLVLPKTFDGTSSFSDWCFHFDNVAAVNGWDNVQKLKWLRVCMTRHAQKTLHR